MYENETQVNDAQATILEEWTGAVASGFNPAPDNAASVNTMFLGENPIRWFLFIGMILLWLWLWGRIVKYLGGHD